MTNYWECVPDSWNGETKIWQQHIHEQVMKNQKKTVEEHIRKNKNRMIDYDFQPGEWVLVLNKSKPAKDEGREPRRLRGSMDRGISPTQWSVPAG